MNIFETSNVKEGAVEAGWRRVTEETVPVPDIIQRARGLCWEKDRTFETISWKKEKGNNEKMHISIIKCQ